MKKIGILIVGLFLVGGLFFFFKLTSFYRAIYTPTISTTPTPQKSVYNLLVLGYAGGKHDGAYLTDTMMLVNVNTKNKKITLISLPRDLWVRMPTRSGDNFHMKINTVYEVELFPTEFPDIASKHFGTKNDANFAKYVVSQVTGQTVDGYIGIDFSSFQKAIDILGGVDVTVERYFVDEQYPLEGKEKDLCGKEEKDLPELEKIATDSPQLAFPCRYEKISFVKGINHMDGTTALKYVRSRHSPQDGGDFGRAARQQRLIEGLRDKVLSVQFVTKIPALIDEMQKYIKTDVSPDLINKFLGELSSARKYTISRLVLTDQNYLKNAVSPNGQYILIPEEGIDKWELLHVAIKNEIASPSGQITR